MKTPFFSLGFVVLLCSLVCFGSTQKDETTKGVSRTYVKEGEDVVLHCSAAESLVNTVIHWKNKDNKEVYFYDSGKHYENGECCPDDQYKGRVSPFYKELKNGNASLNIGNTRIEDTGNYTCVLPRLSSGNVQRSTMELFVEQVFKNRFGLEKGAVNKPHVKNVKKVTEGIVELQCEVEGSSSKPSVEWKTCEGIALNAADLTVSETRGRYDATSSVNVTETETNCFSCVVKQEDIYHMVHQEIIVPQELFEIKSCNNTQHHDAEDRYTLGCDAGVLVVWFSGVVTVLLPLVLALVLIVGTHRGRRWMMGKMNHMIKSMKEMNHRSTNTTSDQNIGNGSKNMMNGPEEEKFMSTNQTSGETKGDFELKIP